MAKLWACAFKSHVAATGAEIVNVFHYHVTSGTITGELGASDVAARVADHLLPEYTNAMASNCVLDEVEAREVVTPGSGDVPESGTSTVNVSGLNSASDGALGPSLCALMKLRTSAAIRSGHGWIFLPPPFNKNALTTNFAWDTSNDFWIKWNALAALVDNEFDQSGTDPRHYTPVVYSRTRHRRGLDPYYFSIDEAVVKSRPTFLRSRLTSP